MYKTPDRTKQRKLLVADALLDRAWLKALHHSCIKGSKVICRAVHDATFNNTTENSIIRLCCFTSLLQIRIVKEHPLKLRASGYCQIGIIRRLFLSDTWNLLFSPFRSGRTKVSAQCAPAHKPEASFEMSEMVEPGGIEPPTSCVQGRRSPS